MDYAEFVTIASAIKEDNYQENDGFPYGFKKPLPEEECFAVYWVSGGLTGGTCYGDSADQPIDAKPEPDMVQVHKLIEYFDVSFAHGMKIMQATSVSKYGDGGYYGNYTNYGIRYISYQTIFDMLTELGYL